MIDDDDTHGVLALFEFEPECLDRAEYTPNY